MGKMAFPILSVFLLCSDFWVSYSAKLLRTQSVNANCLTFWGGSEKLSAFESYFGESWSQRLSSHVKVHMTLVTQRRGLHVAQMSSAVVQLAFASGDRVALALLLAIILYLLVSTTKFGPPTPPHVDPVQLQRFEPLRSQLQFQPYS